MQQVATAPDTTVRSSDYQGALPEPSPVVAAPGAASATTNARRFLPQSVQDNALKASGIGYLIGDAALVGAGLAEGFKDGAFQLKHINRDAVGGGIAFVGGGLSCAHYGKPNQNLQCEMATRHLGNYLRERGIVVTNADDVKQLQKSKTFIGHLDDYMYAHPDEALGFGGVVGGALAAIDGAKIIERKAGVGRNWWRIGSGAFVAAGGLAALLIPEHTEVAPGEQGDGRAGWIHRSAEYLKNHPLTVSSGAYVASNVAGLVAVTRDKKEATNAAAQALRYLNTGSYLLSNIVLGAATKNQEKTYGLDQQHLDSIALVAGRVLLGQPEEVREALLTDMASYLSRQPEVKIPAEDIKKLVQAKLDDIAHGRLSEETIEASVPETSRKWTDRTQASAEAGMVRH